MNPDDPPISPDWKWATSEGNRDLDRLLDRRLTFRETVAWLEEAETLSLRLQALWEEATRQRHEKSADALPNPLI